MQTTVKSELRSFSDVVKQDCKDKMTPKKLEAVVKSAVKNDDRKRGVMLFGLEESDDEMLSDRVDEMFSSLAIPNKPTVSDCFRVGSVKQGASRPVKVMFNIQSRSQLFRG